MVCGSDAHYWRDVGKVPVALRMIESSGIPKDRVINASERGFYAFIEKRKGERSQAATASSAQQRA